jgi:hypothetical protein
LNQHLSQQLIKQETKLKINLLVWGQGSPLPKENGLQTHLVTLISHYYKNFLKLKNEDRTKYIQINAHSSRIEAVDIYPPTQD